MNERPGDAAILERARKWETAGRPSRTSLADYWPAWTWSDVRATPASLVRLVVTGRVKVVGKKWGTHLYRLVEQ